ncbi:dehydrogenase [Aquifex sp.]
MPLTPTSKPLTVKEFDKALCGVCGGCSASCGYIAYLKGDELVDLYGHPHDPNGIGSFCTKGITYIQEIPQNPLRITKPFLREGERFREVSLDEAKNLLREFIKGKVAFFFDRFSGVEEYLIARSITEEVFTDSVYLPFLQTSIRAQEWVEKKALLLFEAEPTFSEVMLTRWIVDAFEKDAFIFAAGSRYTTVFQKSTEKVLTNPEETVNILRAISEGNYEERISNFLKFFGRETVIIVGDTLLKSPFRTQVLKAVKKIREEFGADYSFVGNITPFPHKSLKEFIERLDEFDTLILFGNPFIYLPEEKISLLKDKKVVNFAYFPTITANNSLLVLPRTLFCEREFIGKGFGFLTYSPRILKAPFPNPHEFFEESYSLKDFLEEYGVDLEELKQREGGVPLKMEDIKDYEITQREEEEKGDLWLVCDNTLVEELGHWNPWTHAIEREQFAQVNSKTFEKIGEVLKLGDASLKVQINENVADGVVFVPNAYEEFQPFDPGVRLGRIMRKPYMKVEGLKL